MSPRGPATAPRASPRRQRGRQASAKQRPPSKRGPRRPPLLTPEQEREISGVALIGAGLLLLVVLAIPGGGWVAGPVHDGLLRGLGLGACVASAGLVVTGARLCAGHHWSGGALGAAGSGVVVVAMLSLLGLVVPGSGGVAGAELARTLRGALGWPGGTALAVVGTVLGLVLAVDLRLAPLAASVRAWWGERQRRLAASARPAPHSVAIAQPEPRRRRREMARGETTVTGKPIATLEGPRDVSEAGVHLDLDVGPPPLPPAIARGGGDEREVVDVDATAAAVPEVFRREFEGVVEPVLLAEAPAPKREGDDEGERVWVLPSIDLLDNVSGKRERLAVEVQTTSALIVNTLRSFGIDTRIIGANSGPTVTQYELQPAPGVPVRKIVNYQTDLSLALAAPVRIQPFIPGKSAIGIEVPNKAAQLVSLKEVVQAPLFGDRATRLAVALGADVSGHSVVGDLARMPHLLIAGATGSGKSVCINAVLAGFLLQATPAQLKLILIDPKRVELSGFADVPHLLVPVVVEPEAAVASLRWAVREMEERYKLFASHGARNIATFNERAPGLGLSPLPFTVIVIDELADLMMVAAGEIEDLICRIAQLARAVGIHLIVATQRPSADIITGLIKANIPSRVAFAVSSGVDSRVILDEMGAEKLLGRGDMLYLPIDEGKPRRLQGAFVSDRELDALIEHWKAQGKPDYQEEIFHVEATVSWAREAGKRDPLFAKAAHTVAAEGRAAASLLQRKLNVGYTRAARLVDQLAEHRVVGPYEGSKSREVLMDVIQVDELLADLGEE